MAATDSKAADARRHIFPFFDLPLEMREMIYDESLEDEAVKLLCGFELDLANVPATNMLLVSKDFRREYLLRADKRSQMTIADVTSWMPGVTQFPSPATRVHSIRLQLVFVCHEDDQDHLEWLSELIPRCEKLRVLDARIHYDPHILSFAKARDLISKDWIVLQSLTTLKVYEREIDGVSDWDFKSEEGLCLEWSSVTGKLEEVTEKK